MSVSLLSIAPHVVASVVSAEDQLPQPEDVKAGWLAFAIFIGLIVAVALLGWSLVRQLRKAQAAEDAGLYDPSDRKPRETIPVDQPASPRAADVVERSGEAEGDAPPAQS